jgi:hypothetical protein
MIYSRAVKSLLLPLSVILFPVYFWQHEILVTIGLLVVLSVFMLEREHRKHVPIFMYAALFGPISEAICIASGAWSYTNAQFLIIPLWLPLVWGMAGVHMSEISERLNKK